MECVPVQGPVLGAGPRSSGLSDPPHRCSLWSGRQKGPSWPAAPPAGQTALLQLCQLKVLDKYWTQVLYRSQIFVCFLAVGRFLPNIMCKKVVKLIGQSSVSGYSVRLKRAGWLKGCQCSLLSSCTALSHCYLGASVGLPSCMGEPWIQFFVLWNAVSQWLWDFPNGLSLWKFGGHHFQNGHRGIRMDPLVSCSIHFNFMTCSHHSVHFNMGGWLDQEKWQKRTNIPHLLGFWHSGQFHGRSAVCCWLDVWKSSKGLKMRSEHMIESWLNNQLIN